MADIDDEVIDRHIEESLSDLFIEEPNARGREAEVSKGRAARMVAVATAAAAVVVAVLATGRGGKPGGAPDTSRAAPARAVSVTIPAQQDPELRIVRTADDIDALPDDARAVECIRLDAAAFAGLRRLKDLERLILSDRIEDEGVLFGSRWLLPVEAIELLGVFPKLRVLHVSGDLEAHDLEPLQRLEHLLELHLDDCDVLGGGHLTAITGIAPLRRLRIQGRGEVEDSALRALLAAREFESLELLGDWGLTSAGYQGLDRQQRLRVLDLSAPWYNGGGSGSIVFGSPEGLSVVVRDETSAGSPEASGDGLDDSVLGLVGKLAGLRVLRLRSRRFVTDAGLAALRPLAQLETIDLHQCLGITAAGLGALPASLRTLDVSETTRIVSLPGHLAALQKLSIANGTAFVDDGLKALRMMPELAVLDATGCPLLTDACIGHIAACTKLEDLNLHAHQWLSDEVLEKLAPLPRLRRLDVGSFDGVYDLPTGEGQSGGRTAITAAGLAHLQTTKLTHLDLSAAPPISAASLRSLRGLPLQHLQLSFVEIVWDDETADLDALRQLWAGAIVEWCEPMPK